MSWLSFSRVIGWKTEDSGIESINQLSINQSNSQSSPIESFITISDSPFTPGDSLILDLVSRSLSNTHSVVLVAINRSINHWTQTAKKRGITQSTSQFRIIDVNESLSKNDETTIDQLNAEIDQLFTPSVDILANIFQKLTGESDNQPITIIFDAIDPFALRFGASQMHSFFISLYSSITQKNNQSILCLNMYSDQSTDHSDQSEHLLHSMLTDVADLNLVLAPLNTGSSKEFVGEISYHRRDHTGLDTEANIYHYRIHEGDVQIINKR